MGMIVCSFLPHVSLEKSCVLTFRAEGSKENVSLYVRKADACHYLLTLWEMGPGIIHPFNKYLLRPYFVPSVILGTQDISVNKSDKILVLRGFPFEWGK